MSNQALALSRNNAALAAVQEVLTQEKIELLKRTICKNATDDELELFIMQCNRTRLDPFLRQIYAIKRYDATVKREVMTTQIGIDGFRLLAERTECYLPGRDYEYAYDKHGNLLAATAFVRKWARNEWHEIAHTVYFSEYVQKKADGTSTGMWGKMPHSQLGKCAEAGALRKAFPAELSGLYATEEIPQQNSTVIGERDTAIDIESYPVTQTAAAATSYAASGSTQAQETTEPTEEERTQERLKAKRSDLVKAFRSAPTELTPSPAMIAKVLHVESSAADALFNAKGQLLRGNLSEDQLDRLIHYAATSGDILPAAPALDENEDEEDSDTTAAMFSDEETTDTSAQTLGAMAR